jgi:hypothetical protein
MRFKMDATLPVSPLGSLAILSPNLSAKKSYRSAIEAATEAYRDYEKYAAVLGPLRQELQHWEGIKDIRKELIDKETWTPRYRAAIEFYIGFDEVYVGVTKAAQIFQDTMTLCYPRGSIQGFSQQTLDMIELLEFDPQLIIAQWSKVIQANFLPLKEQNAKMQALFKEMGTLLKDFRKAIEIAAILCGDDSRKGIRLLPTAYFEEDVATAKKAKDVEAAVLRSQKGSS